LSREGAPLGQCGKYVFLRGDRIGLRKLTIKDSTMTGANHFLGANTIEFQKKAREFDWQGGKLEAGVGLALSGGGFRAMLFHAGALQRLNELGILKIDRISSVSGGSIAAGWLAVAWSSLGGAIDQEVFDTGNFKRIVVDKLLAFSKQKIDVMDAVVGLLPTTSAADQAARSYEALVGRKTLQDLPDAPRFVFCATNPQTGVLWRFSKPYAGDYITGRIEAPRFLIAQAIAASAAFPPVLSPLILKPLQTISKIGRPVPGRSPSTQLLSARE
jgi:NTE family protein